MAKGWMGKFIEVDLTTRAVQTRDTMPYAREYIGGRGIAARLAWETIPPGIDAFDPENRLILFTGPLTGTIAPTSGRTVFMSVSPRVYPRPWITHSTMGGWFGSELKYVGFDGLVISGKADAPVYLSIEDDRAVIKDASDLWGLGTREVQVRLKQRHGEKARIMCIGPAGENLVRVATIQHAEECASGHSGFGGVLGSKNLKAVVVRGTQGVEIARPAEMLAETARAREAAWVSPLDGFYDHSAFPKDTPEQAKRRPVCSQSCTMNCLLVNLHRVEGQPDDVTTCIGGVYVATADDPMYETSMYESDRLKIPSGKAFGPIDGVRVHSTTNDLGLDLWLLLTLQPWLLKCLEEGVDTIRGTPLDPADPDWFIEMLKGMAYREGLGGLFSDGLRRAADDLEGELPASLIEAARSLEFAYGFPAHREGRLWDPEPLPYWVFSMLMYASESRDPTIGTHSACLHLANIYLKDGELALKKFRALSKQLWGNEQALEPNFECVAPVAIWAQHQHIMIDSLTLCDFAFPRTVGGFRNADEWYACPDTDPDIEIGARLLSACTGVDYTNEELESIGERVFNLERAMLAEFGRDRQVDASIEPHFELPCKTDGTYLDKALFDELMDSYYQYRGWDVERGWPTREKLEELGLGDVADRLGV